jgi:hypothetical protein
MANLFDQNDKQEAKAIWYLSRYKSVRQIHKLICDKATQSRWDRVPSYNTVKDWINRDWKPNLREVPGAELVLPWGDYWNGNPQSVVALTLMSEIVRELWSSTEQIARDEERRLSVAWTGGFPKIVCEWVGRIKEFFDLDDRRECLALIYFAYLFGNLDRYSQSTNDHISEVTKAANRLLVHWYRTKREPEQAPISGTAAHFSFLWEQSEESIFVLGAEVLRLICGGFTLLLPSDLEELTVSRTLEVAHDTEVELEVATQMPPEEELRRIAEGDNV